MGHRPAKIAGLLSIIAGLVLIVAGALTWFMVSNQLADEKITVPADSPMLPGDDVNGPFSAYAQAQIIQIHALKATGGLTYAELGALQTKIKAEAKAKGIDLDEKDPAKVAEIAKLDGYAEAKADLDKATNQRQTIMTGSFLRASLFTSVVAFGVAALVIGLGALLLVFGWAWLSFARRVVPTPALAEANRTTAVE